MSTTTEPQRRRLTRERLKKKLEVSNFDLNAIFRGAQLTIVGGMLTIYIVFLSFLLPC